MHIEEPGWWIWRRSKCARTKRAVACACATVDAGIFLCAERQVCACASLFEVWVPLGDKNENDKLVVQVWGMSDDDKYWPGATRQG
eukprot:scaffold29951_cov28-Tisochrysis_lutea.AAC.2